MSQSSLGWKLLRYVFTPLVIAAVCVAIAASFLLGCSQPKAVELPQPPSALEEKLERTVKVKADCGDDGKWTGSGVVLTGKLYGKAWVATAQHVAPKADCFYTVETPERYYFAVRGPADKEHDVALLGVTGLGEYVTLENAYGKLGDQVVASGYPFDLYTKRTELSVTMGRIATLYKGKRYQYRVTSAFTGGHSGGPCWSPAGHLVGLTNAGWVRWDALGRIPFDGHYYVSSADYVFELLDQVVDIPDPPTIY